MAERSASGFERSAIEARDGEPQWLRDRRLDSWETYESTPFPTTQLEEWRYTDMKLFRFAEVRAAGETLAGAGLEADGVVNHVVQSDGSAASFSLPAELAGQGVILMDLATAAVEHTALVEPFLATRAVPATKGKFAALNAAFWSGGVFLYVPRGVRVEKTIRILRRITVPGTAVLPRTLIIAEQGSKVGVVEEFSSPDFKVATLACGVVEAFAGIAAQVQYVALQQWGRGVRHISTQRTLASRDAKLDTLVVNLGASVARVDLSAALEGPGARSDMLGLYFADGDQHFDHNTRQDHLVPHATSDLLYKGALTGSAHSVFRGLIKVYPKAQRTDAYQTNRNLLLSEHAQATSLPNLEIEADDVRCSHASTVGHLDQEELFYIMTRGVSRPEAERLVVFGFLGDVLDRLPMPEVVGELRQAIAAKIG
jgi:Fe-S cluster assembly protein SufD